MSSGSVISPSFHAFASSADNLYCAMSAAGFGGVPTVLYAAACASAFDNGLDTGLDAAAAELDAGAAAAAAELEIAADFAAGSSSDDDSISIGLARGLLVEPVRLTVVVESTT